MWTTIVIMRGQALMDLWNGIKSIFIFIWILIRRIFPPKYKWEYICECGVGYFYKFKMEEQAYNIQASFFCGCGEVRVFKIDVPILDAKYRKKKKPTFYIEDRSDYRHVMVEKTIGISNRPSV